MPAISVSHLKKHYRVLKKEPGVRGVVKSFLKREYKQVKAVDDVSFKIKEGELVGFIGPNGAGKTTTLKCLSGLLYPSQGSVEVLGFNPWQKKPEFLKQISLVMGQKNQLWWDLPAIETFNLNKEIYEIADQEYKKTLNELERLLEIKDLLKTPVRKLSLGERMKCELVVALLHSPKILFLDEPTIGLDVLMQKKVRDFIKFYNERKKATIILTSHYMSDVKELCQRVMIIDKGKLVFDGQLEKIVKKYALEKNISVVLAKEVDYQELSKIGKIKEFNYPQISFLVKRKQVAAITSKILNKLPVVDLNIEEPAIEDVIGKLFSKKNYIKKGENHGLLAVDEPIQINHSPKASVQSETENHGLLPVGIYK